MASATAMRTLRMMSLVSVLGCGTWFFLIEEQLYFSLPQAAYDSTAPRTLVWPAPVQGDTMDSCLIARVMPYLTHRGRCALSQCRGLAPTTGSGAAAPCVGVGSVGGRPSHRPSSGPPFCHDGTERPIPRPQDPTEQKTC